jgi:putative tryptophan/tyrosine transport system substrate-binding protein
MSYGANFLAAAKELGVYAGRVLKGEKPDNLAAAASNKIEFVINMKTAKALGIAVSPSLLARADEVIE